MGKYDPLPIIDWNGSGRIDPVDVGISMAVAGAHEEVPSNGKERIALISCSKLKKSYTCRASELYSASTLFSLSYEYAKANADQVYILSAKYGLVAEDEVISPYDETLNEKSPSERKAWSKMVLNQLRQVCDIRGDAFIILAGKHYCEYLLPHLRHAELPLGNLPLGKRTEFLRRNLAHPEETVSGPADAAQQLHRFFGRLPVYNWKTIDDIPFQDGIYIVYEKGETYRGHDRIVRVGIHTSQGRLKRRLKDHFVRENHNGSIFRKNIGKALLNRDRDPYLQIWTLDTSKVPNIGKENKAKEAEIESRVSGYLRESFTFRVFPVATKEERLRLEEAIIATLNQADDFKASSHWLGASSPEWAIRENGMWLKQGLDAEPLTDVEMVRLSQLTSGTKQRTVFKIPGGSQASSPALKAGDRIRHSAFGDGAVLSTRNLGGDTLVAVEFDERGKKRLLLSAAKKHIAKLSD